MSEAGRAVTANKIVASRVLGEKYMIEVLDRNVAGAWLRSVLAVSVSQAKLTCRNRESCGTANVKVSVHPRFHPSQEEDLRVRSIIEAFLKPGRAIFDRAMRCCIPK